MTECISCEVINDDVRRSAVYNTAASKTTVVQSHDSHDSNDQETRVWGGGGLTDSNVVNTHHMKLYASDH